MENMTLSESTNQEAPPAKKEVLLTEYPVNNENDALNVMIGFLASAQKRGAFTIIESAKIWECIKVFQKPVPPASST
jgi:hypothetical protein